MVRMVEIINMFFMALLCSKVTNKTDFFLNEMEFVTYYLLFFVDYQRFGSPKMLRVFLC